MTDLPPSTGDDAVELASRYVDGELSPDERAAAEADAAVMVWVERFGGVRAALREPIEIDAGARDAAIAAALAAVDQDGAVVAPPPAVDELAAARARRSGRLAKWLGAAAAVAAVAVGGAVLAGNSGGRDGDDFADAPSAASEMASTTANGDEQASARSAFDDTEQAPAADATDAASTGVADAAATTAAAGEAPKTGPADESSGGGATDTTASSATTLATLAAAVPTYEQPADLLALRDAPPATVADGTQPPCADRASGELVAESVLYAGVPAVVYRDAATHTLTAWGVEHCDRLADAPYTDG
jgi:hypothetical protein